MGWKEDLERAHRKMNENIIRKSFFMTAVLISNDVIVGTPVDTGRARANWIPSINTPSQETVNSTSADLTKLQEFHKANIVNSLFLSNNLPYILPLEEGHSKQKPQGWVRSITGNPELYVKKALKLVNA